MEKTNMWWNIINSICIVFLFILFIYVFNSYPTLQNKVEDNERMIEKIEYYISRTNQDTIIVKHIQINSNKTNGK